MQVFGVSSNYGMQKNSTGFKSIRLSGSVMENRINCLPEAQRVQFDRWVGEFAETKKGSLKLSDVINNRTAFSFQVKDKVNLDFPIVLSPIVQDASCLKLKADSYLKEGDLDVALWYDSEENAKNHYEQIQKTKVQNDRFAKVDFFEKLSWAVSSLRAIENSTACVIKGTSLNHGQTIII